MLNKVVVYRSWRAAQRAATGSAAYKLLEANNPAAAPVGAGELLGLLVGVPV